MRSLVRAARRAERTRWLRAAEAAARSVTTQGLSLPFVWGGAVRLDDGSYAKFEASGVVVQAAPRAN